MLKKIERSKKYKNVIKRIITNIPQEEGKFLPSNIQIILRYSFPINRQTNPIPLSISRAFERMKLTVQSWIINHKENLRSLKLMLLYHYSLAFQIMILSYFMNDF